MKRVFTLLMVTIIVLSLPLSGCTKAESPYQIDREIIGQVIAVDSQGDFSVLYFSDDLVIEVTNNTLNQWRVDNMFKNTWTYKFQETFIKNRYDLVGIEDENLPLQGDIKS